MTVLAAIIGLCIGLAFGYGYGRARERRRWETGLLVMRRRYARPAE